MKYFKKGDRVKRVEGHYQHMEIGDTDIVVKDVVNKYGSVSLKKFGTGHSQKSLKVMPTWRERMEE